MEKITIYPCFNAHYYSFYLYELRKRFQRRMVHYSIDDFPAFHHHCLAFVLDAEPEIRIYISAGDGPGFNEEGLAWADVYAKVNIEPGSIPAAYAHKVLPIGPSFGIRLWSPMALLWQSVRTYRLGRSQLELPREHFANYYRQFRYRLPLGTYTPEPSLDNYIFFAGSLWKNEAQVNQHRARFMEACKATPGVQFEGGFAPRKHSDVEGFNHLTMAARYTFLEYQQKIKRSAMVLNTPAVDGCLGWKLGEFLALGKAIISVPITRELPAPLVHGQHIHYVDGSPESIQQAIMLILSDKKYRAHLENGARDYFLKYLDPAQVLNRIFEAAKNHHQVSTSRL